MQTILSSAPEARYLLLLEKRTQWMVPEWVLIAASCFGLVNCGSVDCLMASVDHIRTWASVGRIRV